ncbi:hypothetical protein KSF_064790 [Reticulibacter mediterranei]|uniref:InsA N-terminal zinc ribbon domain-containing protein n=1 Tax=Reticulibacter mediterranei TaxID=2778369 RepID=A0A8J3IKZ5_9CHLR|nr:tetratricopeptide repeat protein [Reticulibacter mediterranei]GHO96431.1 hypothetical protein KSF_064790 [Reticulibacter mediterranei]
MHAIKDNYEQAESLYLRALRVREQQLGPEHPDVVAALQGLAQLSARQGKDEQAERLYQRALHTCEQQLGPASHQIAEVLYDFAQFRQMQGRSQDAVSLYQRALTIREHALGLDSHITIDTRTRLLETLAVLEQTEEAAVQNGGQASKSNDLPQEALPADRKSASQEKQATESSAEEDLVPACPQCQQTDEVLKGGKNRSGTQRFRCRACHLYFTPQPSIRQPDQTRKAQALALAQQGMSYRRIARDLGVHHQTVSGWISPHGPQEAE